MPRISRLIALGLLAAQTSYAARPAPAPPTAEALYTRICAAVAAGYDSSRGGFALKSGVPVESAVELAFIQGRDGGPIEWPSRARATVDWTWSLFDSVGGGFYHRQVNTRSDIPTFEKRTSSNARRLENLIDAWQSNGDSRYRVQAAQVVDYMDRVLLDGRGGFADGQVGDLTLVPESDGLAIHAWLRWAAASALPRFRDFALLSLDRTWAECWRPPFGMMRRGTFGQPLKVPQLVDQIQTGRAYVLAAHLGGRAVDLERACTIGDLLIQNFEDKEKGGWRTQAAADKSGKIKSAARDPAENALAVRFLCELAAVSGKDAYREAARRGFAANAGRLEKLGLESADWALAIRALNTPDLPMRPEWRKSESSPPPSPKRPRVPKTGKR